MDEYDMNEDIYVTDDEEWKNIKLWYRKHRRQFEEGRCMKSRCFGSFVTEIKNVGWLCEEHFLQYRKNKIRNNKQ